MKRYPKFFLFAALITAGLTSDAGATVVQTTYRIINNGKADFGSGFHSGGSPSGNATITYDWTTTQTGLMGSTGRVRGTLYWDALHGGCARLTIRFRNSANANLDVRSRSVCGPGFNANSSPNQISIDEDFGSTALDRIVITTSEVTYAGVESNVSSITITQVTTKTFPVTISNGTADFGDGDHHFGVPDLPGSVSFVRNGGGLVTGIVDGVLYWDSPGAESCSRLIIEFRNINGVVLARDTFTNCGTGGDANVQENQTAVFNRSFTSGAIFDIRLRVDDIEIAGDTITNTFGFAGITPN